MNRVANPYRPGFNETPGELAGREDVLEDLREAIEVAALDGRTPRPTLLTGPRGVGKTVLLAEAATLAGAQFGWPRVHVEARPKTAFTPDLAAALGRTRELIEQPRSKPPLKTESMTVHAGVPGLGAELRLARTNLQESHPAPALRSALLTLAETAAAHGSGFVLTFDEAQLATREELATVAALLQEGTGEGWPVVVVIAGLPAMRAPEHSVTYFERGSWHELGLLSRSDAVRALSLPAAAAGRPLDEDAAVLLARASGGYPYAIQLYGHHAWRASATQQRIDLAAARRAMPRAQRELEHGLYAARWTAASSAQRRYLTALATLVVQARPSTARAVADELGRTTKQLSTVRDQLIKAGTVTVDGDRLRFTIPGMSAYVLAR